MSHMKYFIPIDFSEASYKAIQYASMLAVKTSGTISLGYVINTEEINESDNPTIVQVSLNRLEKKAADKMQSLMEIISATGIAVTNNIEYGKLCTGVLKLITQSSPDVIILSRKTTDDSKSELFSYLTKHCKQPILVVPDTVVPQFPERAVVATDLRSEDGELEALFQLISNSATEVSLLNIKNGTPSEMESKARWITMLESKYGRGTKLLQHHDESVVAGVMNFVRTNPVDLVCTIKRKKNFLTRAFSACVSEEIARQAQVPVLVICR